MDNQPEQEGIVGDQPEQEGIDDDQPDQEEIMETQSTEPPPLNRLRTLFYQPPPTVPIFGGPDRYTEPIYPQLPMSNQEEWEYNMRRTMQEIVPNVFLGPYASAVRTALDSMLAAGLTHVVCVRSPAERTLIRPNHPNHFKYLLIELEDKLTENIICHFAPVIDFINDALANNGKVLVHGNGGTSKSPALVMAYVMNRYGVTIGDALRQVQQKRFCASPNEGFMNQLREYEPIYRAKHIVPIPIPDMSDTTVRVSKRPLSDSEDEEPDEKKVAIEPTDTATEMEED